MNSENEKFLGSVTGRWLALAIISFCAPLAGCLEYFNVKADVEAQHGQLEEQKEANTEREGEVKPE